MDNNIIYHSIQSEPLERELTINVYLPSGKGPFPVLYMHDGHNLFDLSTSSFNQIWQVQDAFVYDITPMIVVGIDAPQDIRRMDELSPFANSYSKGKGDVYLAEVLRVKAFIDNTYPTKPERDYTGIMGSSMGGVISTAALAKYSDVFSKFGLISSAYWIDDRIFDYVEQSTIQPSKVCIWMWEPKKKESKTPMIIYRPITEWLRFSKIKGCKSIIISMMARSITNVNGRSDYLIYYDTYLEGNVEEITHSRSIIPT